MKAGDLLILNGRSYEILRVAKQSPLDDVYHKPTEYRLHIKQNKKVNQ